MLSINCKLVLADVINEKWIVDSDEIWTNSTDLQTKCSTYVDASDNVHDMSYLHGIEITSSATLVLTVDELKLNPTALIIVNIGSRLIIENTTIREECGGFNCGPWEGIVIKGNPNSNQNILGSSRNQGLLIMRDNAKLHGAHYPIKIEGGGVALVNNSIISNCIIGVDMQSYPNSNKTYFRNTLFTSEHDPNDEYGNIDMVKFVNLTDVEGVRFEGCTFEYHPHTGDSKPDYGIYSSGSTFKLQKSLDLSSLPGNCSRNGDRNTFSKLTYGVHLAGPEDSDCEILQSDFYNCTVGVACIDDENTTMYLNSFVWDEYFYPKSGAYFSDVLKSHTSVDMPQACGILYSHSTELKVFENEFSWNLANMGTGNVFYSYGIAGKHTEYQNSFSEFFHNAFGNVGTYSQQNMNYINGIVTDVSGLTSAQQAQLHVSCNDFTEMNSCHILYAENPSSSQRLIDQGGRDYYNDVDANNTYDVEMSSNDHLINVNTGYYIYKTNLSMITSGNITIDDTDISTTNCDEVNACDYFDNITVSYPNGEPVDEIDPDLGEPDPDWRRDINEYDDMLIVDEPIEQSERRLPDFEDEIPDENYVSIYPNPAEDHFSISFNTEKAVHAVTVFDIHGRGVYSIIANTNCWHYSITNKEQCLQSGLYLLKLTFKDGSSEQHKLLIK
ncbi:MAG: T9SS type A sorting domain-containing protein [Bacteroidetes bacterium]|nr:T9SS type A sorting domain-containing protein [Bacteroidota bacterium]